MIKFRYDVVITGHEPPYSWEVKRSGPGSVVTPKDCRGESDDYYEALFDAAIAARRAEWRRRHESTKRREHLFTVNEDDPIVIAKGTELANV